VIVDRLEYSQVPLYLAEVVTGSSVPVSGAHPVVSKFEVIIILFICILLFLFSPPFPVFRLLSAVSVRRLVCFLRSAALFFSASAALFFTQHSCLI